MSGGAGSDPGDPPADWPHRAASRRIEVDGLYWHVQRFGRGEPLLLVHGTGASVHSWRDIAPVLAGQFEVIAPDLPGHGYTGNPGGPELTLPAMARRLTGLLNALRVRPVLAAGHSAGAAILARMALDGAIAPRCLVSVNGALLPFTGVPGWLFAPLAQLLAASTWVPRAVARIGAQPTVVRRLIADTGSHLDAHGMELYRRLVMRPQHVAAALGMMARWDLTALARDLPQLRVPLALLVAAGDRTIAPAESTRVQQLLPQAQRIELGMLGHLAHEEDPALVSRILAALAQPVCSPS